MTHDADEMDDQLVDDDFAAGFDEEQDDAAGDGDGGQGDEGADAGDDAGDGDDAAQGEGADADGSDAEGEGDDDQGAEAGDGDSALDAATKRGQELLSAQGKGKAGQDGQPGKPDGQQQQAKPSGQQQQQAQSPAAEVRPVDATRLKTAVESLKGRKVDLNGTEFDLGQVGEEFPEAVVAAAVLAEELTQQRVTPLQQQVEQLTGELSTALFWMDVEAQQPGTRALVHSDAFQAWFGKQSEAIKALGQSGDPKDALTVVGAYQEQQARATAKRHDTKAAQAKQKRDDLHKHTLRQKPSSRSQPVNEDSFDDGWDLSK